MKNNSNNNKLTIRFKQNGQYISVSPQYMLLSWYGASDKSKTRTYKFKISVLKEKDGEYETLKENGQDKVWEQTVGYEVREQGYDLTNEESSKQAQKIDFTSLGAIYGLRIELDVSSGDGYFALWDVFVDGVTRRRNIIDSTEPLCVEANETGKYKAVRSNNTEYIPILDDNPVSTNLTAQDLCNKIDAQLEGAEYPVEGLAKPTILKLDRKANPYKLSWNKVDYAYQYKVRVNIYSSESGGNPDSTLERC